MQLKTKTVSPFGRSKHLAQWISFGVTQRWEASSCYCLPVNECLSINIISLNNDISACACMHAVSGVDVEMFVLLSSLQAAACGCVHTVFSSEETCNLKRWDGGISSPHAVAGDGDT